MELNNQINQLRLQQYASYLADQGLSDASIRRKLSSLTSFHKFLTKKKLVSSPRPTVRPTTAVTQATTPNPVSNIPPIPTQSRSPFFNRYFLIASIILLLSGLGYTLYTQVFNRANKNLAYSSASSPVTPNRILSFQGRLTDSFGNPISSSTGAVFKLYTLSTGGTELYTSGAGNSQTVIPDENGIFSVVIGKSHGLGIPSSVFSENAEVWLEITAGGETMNPRQQIATVGYALNSETLQGLPPSASGMKNTVLVIDGSGNLNLGETSPTIYSQSGTLGIIGQALLIGTSDGSGGNITINPDGAGKLRILTEGTGSTATGGFIEASNANLATGNLFSGYINNDNRGYNFLDFSNYNVGTTALSSRFSIDAYGNLASAGTINTSIGITTPRITISVGSSAGYILSSDASGNASWMSPASIGATYDSTNGITKSSNVFKLGGQITENTRLNIGNTEVLYISQSTGNVGIGTTDTTYKLQVSGGDVAIDNNKNFYWGSGATQTYLNVNSGIMNYYYSGTRQLEINLNPSSSNSILSFEGNLAIGTTATNSDLIFSPKRNAYLSSGNFGIGTTAPNYKLEVSGDALISTRLGIGSTNALYAFNVGGTSMLADIFGSSSLAIGTTAPTYKLELVGSNSLLRIGDTAGNTLVDISETSAQFNLPTTFTSTGDVNIANDLNFTNQTASTIRSNAPLYLEAGESFENNDLTLKTFNLGNVVLDTAGLTLLQAQSWTLATGTTNALNVSNGLISIDTLNSRVGIGTSSPTKKLDVTGDINLTGTIFANGTSGTSGQVLISTGTGLQWVPNVGTTYTFTNGITLTGSTVGLGGTLTQNTQIGTSSFHIDFIGLGGTQALRIDESGNIGIGGTSSVAKLDITGNTVIRGSLGVGGTNPGYGLSVSGTGDSGSIYASSYVISPGIRGTLYNGVTRIGMSSSDTVFQGYNGSIVEAFRYDGSGQLGVGITVPKAKLHVNGIGSSVIAIFDGSGNVGIGTTAPVEKLHVNGAIRLPKSQYIAWADGSAGDYADSITVSDSPSWLPKLNVQTFQVYDSSAASGAWVFRGSSTGNPIMTILANAGNVGIGTTAPSKKLDITGDINLTGTIFTNGTSGSNGQILTSTGVGLSWVPSSAVGATYTFTNGLTNTSGTVRIGGTLTQNTQIGTSSFNLSYLGSGGVQGLFLSSNGNVGIGHTNPLAKLVIEGTSNPEIRIYENTGNPGTYGALSLNANPFDNTVWAQLRGVVTSANDAEISFLTTSDAGSNLTEKMRLSSTGSLGIGTTSPTKKLDVAGDINLTGTIFANGSSGSSGQVLSSTGTGLQWISNVGSTYTFSNGLTLTGSTVRIGGTLTQNTDIGTSSFSLNIGHGSTLAMYISSGGAVGFGTNVVSGGKVTVDGGNMNISTGYAYAIGSSPFMSYRNNAALILNENSTAQSIGMYGNVGIGTTAPISKLYVVGTGSSHIAIFNGSGNVGIGTTNPTHNFEIAGTDNNFYFDKAGGLLVTNSNALGSLAEFRGYDSNSSYFDANANLYITTGKGIAVDTIASYSTNALMSINSQGSGNLTLQNTSTGNVGIGTSNPTKKLSVAGDINLTGTIFANGTSGSSGQVLSSTGTGLQWVAAGAGTTYTFTNGLTNTSGTVRIGGTLTQNTQIGTSSFSLNIGQGGTQALYIASTGRVGIGTTNPTHNFEIAGTDNNFYFDKAGGLLVTNSNALGSLAEFRGYDSNSSYFDANANLYITTGKGIAVDTIASYSTNALMSINSQGSGNLTLQNTSTGNVGIGTSNPTKKLSVAGDINLTGTIFANGTSGSSGQVLSSTGTGLQWVAAGAGTTYTFTNGLTNTSGTVRIGGTLTQNTQIGTSSFSLSFLGLGNSQSLFIGASGYVGIGTTNPAKKLDVAGDIKLTGTIFVGAGVTGSSGQILASDGAGGLQWVNDAGGTGGVGTTYTFTNGLTNTSGTVRIGGTLTQNTQIGTSSFSLSFLGLGNTQSLFIGASGYVGIGTTNPTHKLDLYGSANDYLGYIYNVGTTTNTAGLYVRSDGLGSLLTLNSGGTDIVTITATQTTFNNPVNFTSSGDVSAGYDLVFTNNSSSSIRSSAPLSIQSGEVFNSSNLTLTTYNSGQLVLDTPGGVTLNQAQNWTLGNGSTSTTALNIQSGLLNIDTTNSRIGIGTTAPSKKLDIAGDINLTGTIFTTGTTGASGQVLSSNGAGGLSWITPGGATYYANNGLTMTGTTVGLGGTMITNTTIGTSSFSLLFTGLGGTQALFVGSSGYVGVGTTAPISPLSVNGNITASKFASIFDYSRYFADPGNSTSTNGSVSLHGNGSITFNTETVGTTQVAISANASSRIKSFANGLSIATNIGSTGVGSTINWNETLFVGTSGFVSIGSTSQLGSLGIVNDGNLGIVIDSSDSNPSRLNFGINTSVGAWFNSTATGSGTTLPFVFATQGIERFRIATNGAVGFGTTSPLGVFEVKVNGTGGTSALNIAANGKVGIGTSSAALYQLDVRGTNSSGVAFFRNLQTGNTVPTMLVQTASTGLGTTGGEYIRFVNSTGAKVGRIRIGTAVTAVVYGTNGTNDLAEYQIANEPTDAADLISFDNGKYSRYTPGSTIAGIHSSYATLVGNESLIDQPNAFPLAISGIVKLKVSTQNGPIHQGDPLTGSNIIATASKAVKPGYIVARALESYTNPDPSQVGTIEVIIGLNWYDPDVFLTESGEVNVNHNISDAVLSSLGYTASKNEIESATYSLSNSLGQPVTRLAQFAQISSAKIKAGLVSTTNLIAKNIIAETTKSKEVKTAVLTPLSDITDTIVVDGKLAASDIQTTSVTTDRLTASEATVSTLYAENIISKEGSFGQVMTDKIAALREEIRSTIASIGTTDPISTPSALVAEVPNWTFDNGTSQTIIEGSMNLSDNLVVGAKLSVLGDTQLGNAFITGTFTAGEVAIKENFIETTASVLHIQPSGLGSVNVMNNTLVIAENGEVTVNGNLAVSGNINSTSLFANLINADEINTKKLTTESINVATASATPIIAESGFAALATSSASLATNATAGSATLPAGKTELVIYNTKVTSNSIIYLTPAGSTGNQVVYLKSKYISPTPSPTTSPEATSSATSGSSFTIAIDQPLSADTNINWWIIN